jgi:hypothetical protein
MFGIFSHKRNSNKNLIAFPSDPNQNGFHQENKQQKNAGIELVVEEPSYTIGKNVN